MKTLRIKLALIFIGIFCMAIYASLVFIKQSLRVVDLDSEQGRGGFVFFFWFMVAIGAFMSWVMAPSSDKKTNS